MLPYYSREDNHVDSHFVDNPTVGYDNISRFHGLLINPQIF